jgi:hypothetical protein
MKKENVIPLAGHLFACFLCWLWIHFWLAEFVARLQGISFRMSYLLLTLLLSLYGGGRAVLIAGGKDVVANYIERWFDRKR